MKSKAYFIKKARYACGVNRKEHILVNFGQFEDETTAKNHANWKCLKRENAMESQKGYRMQQVPKINLNILLDFWHFQYVKNLYVRS